MFDFKLPDVGEGISEGELIEWRIASGDTIDEGDIVAEVATDKVTVELPSPVTGRVTALHAHEGAVVPVGSVLMSIDDGTGDPGATRTTAAATAETPVPVATTPGAPGPAAPAAAPAGDPVADAIGRVIAAPSTRRYAALNDVDLTRVAGTGPGGRILREDVERAIPGAATRSAAQDPAPIVGAAPVVERVPIRGMRAVSFDHMAASASTTATSTTTFEVHADGLLALVQELRPEAEQRGVKITPVVVVAACLATVLTRHERLNATVDADARELVLHRNVDIGIAVATPRGLVVPVLRDVPGRRLLDLAADLSGLSARARDGALELDELRGGTFTLSSTGSMETATIVATNPVINLPQTATMWTSRIADRPRVRDGGLEAGPVMVCSLSFDHRVVDGAEATTFINELAAVLTAPTRGLV